MDTFCALTTTTPTCVAPFCGPVACGLPHPVSVRLTTTASPVDRLATLNLICIGNLILLILVTLCGRLIFRYSSVRAQKFAKNHQPQWTLSRSEEHTSELQSRQYLVCRLLLEK